MTKKQFLAPLLSASLLTSGLVLPFAKMPLAQANINKPNLMFLLIDEQRFDSLSHSAVGARNNPALDTPNMNALAADGALFTRAYSICPVCVPARSSIFTGTSIYNTGVTGNDKLATANANPDSYMTQRTYDEILIQDFGYYGIYNGKWHAPDFKKTVYTPSVSFVGSRINELQKIQPPVFDRNNPTDLSSVPPGQQPAGTYPGYTYKPNIMDLRYNQEPGFIAPGPSGNEGQIHGELLVPSQYTEVSWETDRTIVSIDKAIEKQKPFTIHLSINEPHAPYYVPTEYYDLYIDDVTVPENIGVPETNNPNYAYDMGNGRLKETQYSDPAKVKQFLSDYYGMVKQNDDNIGRLVQHLKDTNQYDNTIFILTADHGSMVGSHGLYGKNNFHEEALRVPMIIVYPDKIAPNTIIDEPVNSLDMFATIFDYMEIDGYTSDGRSLRPLIEGTAAPDDFSYTVSEWGNNSVPTLCVVTKEWKLMCATKFGVKSGLYDLVNDPYEKTNLIGSNPNRENYRDIVEELSDMLKEYLTRVEHPLLDIVERSDFITGLITPVPVTARPYDILIPGELRKESEAAGVKLRYLEWLTNAKNSMGGISAPMLDATGYDFLAFDLEVDDAAKLQNALSAYGGDLPRQTHE